MTILKEIKTLQFWNLITHYIECGLLLHGIASFQSWEDAYRKNHFYAELDESQKQAKYSNLFATVSIIGYLSTSVSGFIIDSFGSWYSRSVGKVLMLTGIFINMNTTVEQAYLMYPGWVLFISGGWMLLDTNMYCYILYKTQMGFISSITGVGISLGQLWYLLYTDWALPFENLQNFWWIMLAFLPLTAMRTFFLMPKLKVTMDIRNVGWSTRYDTYDNFYNQNNDENEKNNNNPDTKDSQELEKLQDNGDNEKSDEKPSQELQDGNTLLKELLKPQVILLFVFWFVVDMRMITYYSKFQSWMGETIDIPDHSDLTKQYTRLLALQSITEPICGFILDRVVGFVRKTYDLALNKAIACATMGAFFIVGLLASTNAFIQWSVSIDAGAYPTPTLNATEYADLTPAEQQNFDTVYETTDDQVAIFKKAVFFAACTAVTIESLRWSSKFMFYFSNIDPRFLPRIMAIGTGGMVLANFAIPFVSFTGQWKKMLMIIGVSNLAALFCPFIILYFVLKS